MSFRCDTRMKHSLFLFINRKLILKFIYFAMNYRRTESHIKMEELKVGLTAFGKFIVVRPDFSLYTFHPTFYLSIFHTYVTNVSTPNVGNNRKAQTNNKNIKNTCKTILMCKAMQNVINQNATHTNRCTLFFFCLFL